MKLIQNYHPAVATGASRNSMFQVLLTQYFVVLWYMSIYFVQHSVY